MKFASFLHVCLHCTRKNLPFSGPKCMVTFSARIEIYRKSGNYIKRRQNFFARMATLLDDNKTCNKFLVRLHGEYNIFI